MNGVQLTKRPNEQKDVNEPIFSRDGRYLFYSQDATPGDTFEYDKDSNKQIYVVKRLDLQKGETENYITGPGGACRPVPSPDGKQVAFVRRVGARLDCMFWISNRVQYDWSTMNLNATCRKRGPFMVFIRLCLDA